MLLPRRHTAGTIECQWRCQHCWGLCWVGDSQSGHVLCAPQSTVQSQQLLPHLKCACHCAALPTLTTRMATLWQDACAFTKLLQFCLTSFHNSGAALLAAIIAGALYVRRRRMRAKSAKEAVAAAKPKGWLDGTPTNTTASSNDPARFLLAIHQMSREGSADTAR